MRPMQRRCVLSSAAAFVSFLATSAPPGGPAIAAESALPFDAMAKGAFRAFEKGAYAESEQLWQQTTLAYPSEPLGWENYAVALIILASMTRAFIMQRSAASAIVR